MDAETAKAISDGMVAVMEAAVPPGVGHEHNGYVRARAAEAYAIAIKATVKAQKQDTQP